MTYEHATGGFHVNGEKMAQAVTILLIWSRYLAISDHNTAFFGHSSTGKVKVNFTHKNDVAIISVEPCFMS